MESHKKSRTDFEMESDIIVEESAGCKGLPVNKVACSRSSRTAYNAARRLTEYALSPPLPAPRDTPLPCGAGPIMTVLPTKQFEPKGWPHSGSNRAPKIANYALLVPREWIIDLVDQLD
jgi:hypothetical protein